MRQRFRCSRRDLIRMEEPVRRQSGQHTNSHVIGKTAPFRIVAHREVGRDNAGNSVDARDKSPMTFGKMESPGFISQRQERNQATTALFAQPTGL